MTTKPEQYKLMDVPEERLTPMDRKARRIAQFNLLAWGSHDKAISELSKDAAPPSDAMGASNKSVARAPSQPEANAGTAEAS